LKTGTPSDLDTTESISLRNPVPSESHIFNSDGHRSPIIERQRTESGDQFFHTTDNQSQQLFSPHAFLRYQGIAILYRRLVTRRSNWNPQTAGHKGQLGTTTCDGNLSCQEARHSRGHRRADILCA